MRTRAVPARRPAAAGGRGRAGGLRRHRLLRPLPALVGAGRGGARVGVAGGGGGGGGGGGAVAQATSSVPLGTAVTPAGARYHPASIAQMATTLELLAPGRAYLGVGSGESLNESPLGMDWPSVGEQVDRMEEGLELMHRLFDGERVSGSRFWKTKDAVLHTRAPQRPPLYVSAFGE